MPRRRGCCERKGRCGRPFFMPFFVVMAGEGTCGESPRPYGRGGRPLGARAEGAAESWAAGKRRGGRLFFMPFFWGGGGVC